jgi:hypothetical protein
MTFNPPPAPRYTTSTGFNFGFVFDPGLDGFREKLRERLKFAFAEVIFRQCIQPEPATTASPVRPSPARKSESVEYTDILNPFVIQNVHVYGCVMSEQDEAGVLQKASELGAADNHGPRYHRRAWNCKSTRVKLLSSFEPGQRCKMTRTARQD